MKSAKFWAGVALLALLSYAPFTFGVAAFGPRAGNNFGVHNNGTHTSNFGSGGGWGGGGGCGQQGGGGGWGGGGGNGWGGNGNGGWGGNGGNGGNGGCVPEGGNSLEYLVLGALACTAAIAYRSRQQNTASLTE
jgi:hypothetical protein